MDEFLKEIENIKRGLDQIEIGLMMNAEAIESIEMSLRFLEVELDSKTISDS